LGNESRSIRAVHIDLLASSWLWVKPGPARFGPAQKGKGLGIPIGHMHRFMRPLAEFC
jgi:hypothetical protein